MIQFKQFSWFILALCFCCLSSCSSESDVFLGDWQDTRELGNIWLISQNGSTFQGKRVSGSDFYKYEAEEWTFEIGEGGFPNLVPVNEGGSTLTFLPKQNRFLRNPPGRMYVKVIKDPKE